MLLNIIETVIKILAIIVPLLIAVAYVTLAERKIFASMQLRVGPNVVGVWGLLQPLADGVKLFTKETILPTHANLVIFLIAPVIALTLALLT
jgi:NADH-quinone oxidoreductase subunit H